MAWNNGWVKPIRPRRELDLSVGIIGSGPGGLAAADRLRRAGVQITVYDRYDRAGGLMIYGIPGFKLEKDVVNKRNTQLTDGGIKLELNCDVGKGVSFSVLRERYDAVIIATGVYKIRDIKVSGAERAGVVQALDFLTVSNKVNFGDKVETFQSGELNAKGKKVVVIGGGDTAMDCVRTAVRQSATSVKCMYRRDRANMPGSQREVQNAKEEGVVFEWLSAPKAFGASKDFSNFENATKLEGPSQGVLGYKMRLGSPDATGRRVSKVIEGSEYVEEADLVIKALGFESEDLPTLFDEPKLPVTRWGTVKAAFETGKTELDGVYAVGDIVRGASLVVWPLGWARYSRRNP